MFDYDPAAAFKHHTQYMDIRRDQLAFAPNPSIHRYDIAIAGATFVATVGLAGLIALLAEQFLQP